MPAQKPKILFLCTGNSCRSQMAEGWARALRKDVFEAYSAGTAPQGLNPIAVASMAAAGVDISDQRSKSVSEFVELGDVDSSGGIDHVIAVCDAGACPSFPAPTTFHPFDDPPAITAGWRDNQQIRVVYDRVRDEIREFVLTLPDAVL